MKKGQKITIIILIIVLIVTGLSLTIYNFYKGYKEDKIKTEEFINNISTNYNIFLEDLNNINTKRELVYNEIFKETYYTDMQNNIDNWNNLMSEYSKSVATIVNNSEYLKNNCTDIKFYHSDINPKCELFIENYEMIENFIFK